MSTPSLSLQDATPEIQKFFDDNIELWADEEILETMRDIATAAGMSDNYINSLKIIKTGFATVKIYSTHPHAKKIEFGTKPHVITPKGSTGGRNTAKALKVPEKYAGGILAKVNHPGTRPYLIMTKGWELGLPKFRERAKREQDNFKRSMQ